MHGTAKQAVEVPPLILFLVKKISERALKALKNDEEVEPVIFFFKEDAKEIDGIAPQVGMLPVGPLMNSGRGKEFIAHIMEDTVEQEDVDIVIMVTEAWLAQIPAHEIDFEAAQDLKVSERDDKEEVVLFSIMTKSSQYLGSSKIIREPELKLEELDIFQMTDETQSEGRLVRKRPTKH